MRAESCSARSRAAQACHRISRLPASAISTSARIRFQRLKPCSASGRGGWIELSGEPAVGCGFSHCSSVLLAIAKFLLMFFLRDLFFWLGRAAIDALQFKNYLPPPPSCSKGVLDRLAFRFHRNQAGNRAVVPPASVDDSRRIAIEAHLERTNSSFPGAARCDRPVSPALRD